MGRFILKNIDMSLSEDSVWHAIEEVRKLKEDLAEALAQLARILTDQGAQVAKMEVYRMTHWNGTLGDSIIGFYDTHAHTGYIYTNVEYAVLVEYGTGFQGKERSHPGIKDTDWNNPSGTTVGGTTYSDYDQNNHGIKGWKYRLGDSDTFVWTNGEPSKPFMYNAYKDIKDTAEKSGWEYVAQYVL